MVRLAVALMALALGLAAAGCGGDDSETASVTDWANDLCSAVQDWTGEIETIGTELTSSPSEESLRAAASDLGSSTDTFVEQVRELGAPETEAGAEAESAIRELADTVEAEKQEIEDAVDDVSGITGLTSAISSVAASLTAMGEAFQATFERLEGLDAGEELEQAFEDADACDELTDRS